MSSNIDDFMHELQGRVSGEVRTDTYNRMLYSTDASIYQVMPHGVLLPRTADDVQAAIDLAAAYRVPVLPRGGGSSLAGQAINEALILDMTKHLNQILDLNTEEQWVRVQPGVVHQQLNDYLKPTGLQFGPDPASGNRAAMGGIVGNNSTGSHSIMYGMTADHIIEATVILSDGSKATFGPLEAEQLAQKQRANGLEGKIYRAFTDLIETDRATIEAGTPHHWRRCGGYNLDRFVESIPQYYPHQDPRFNLAKLICGSEGTLGTIIELKLNLVPIPMQTALAIVHFPTLSDALKAVPIILQVKPSASELLDKYSMDLCRDLPAYRPLLNTFVEGDPAALLLTEFYGENEADLQHQIDGLRDHLKREGVNFSTIVPGIDPKIQQNVWTIRKAGLGIIMSQRGDHKPIPFIEDSAVPVEYLDEYVRRIEEFCQDLGTDVVYYAHASAGCLHIRPSINAKVASEVAKLPQISAFAVELLGEYGGVLSSEHGDGRARSWQNEVFFGKALYGLFQRVKQAFDPHNILNPGNVVNAGPMTTNLRYGEGYQTIDLKEQVDFSDDLGFHRAVEMCNGAGVCRKMSGSMCPSFMATKEEEHSTRGRANALRAALSGKIPTEELTSKRMYDVMDLCVQCKACKSECPSSVDMAKIKNEFLAHYHERHGVSLRTRIFADINLLSHLSSGALAPLINAVNGSTPVRWALDKFLGIGKNRTLPQFAREPFHLWFRRREKQRNGHAPRSKRQVVLFNDTFNTFNYPHTAIAATEVLEAADCSVTLPGHRCCGRPMLSKGLISQARRAAKETIDKLAPLARQGLPIIGLEPSCILTLTDEYFSLLPNDPRVEMVAKQCYTFEEYMAKLDHEGELDSLQFADSHRRVLLHGHCHQKALVGTRTAHTALSLPPGYTVSEVDASCCGMAGAFGYEAEHYDISLKMGELKLLPAVRDEPMESIIAAAGVSCRQQIKHGTGRQALHPAEVLRQALG